MWLFCTGVSFSNFDSVLVSERKYANMLAFPPFSPTLLTFKTVVHLTDEHIFLSFVLLELQKRLNNIFVCSLDL